MSEYPGHARQRAVNPSCDSRLEDLLGRPQARCEGSGLSEHLAGRIVLVTGAGGSIGSELCRQIARHRPGALIGFDQAETGLYQVEQELRERFPDLEFHPAIGSIQNRRRLEELFREHRPESVYHAAAYKHVPLMEAHLFEAVENNVLGTRNLACAASGHGAEEFVLVSSDKAVRPVGVMGATKRVAEMICQAESGRTRFLAVRFGNVMESSGSVIPNFRRQIEAGGPVTVTHPDMRRYFMTIPEAAELVLRSAAMGRGGEIFVLEMGEPVRILDLARKMILLSGLRPDIDIPIVFSGIRPGEKLHEEVIALEENTSTTPHAQIRVFLSPVPPGNLQRTLDELERATDERDGRRLSHVSRRSFPVICQARWRCARRRTEGPGRGCVSSPIARLCGAKAAACRAPSYDSKPGGQPAKDEDGRPQRTRDSSSRNGPGDGGRATLAIWSADPFVEWAYEAGVFMLAGWVDLREDFASDRCCWHDGAGRVGIWATGGRRNRVSLCDVERVAAGCGIGGDRAGGLRGLRAS